MIGLYDDPEMGPGYWEPEGDEDAFREGAASRDAEVSALSDELAGAEQVIAEQAMEIERLTAMLAAATRAERDRIAWLAEGMANKLHTFDTDMVAGCLADLVACLRSDK